MPLMAVIALLCVGGPTVLAHTDSTQSGAKAELLPIISYDTDVGFGYGVKVFVLNLLEQDESFDLVFFNSTKGERWYRLVFSLPDFEKRQGTCYPFAVDVVVDYDKWVRSSFFGIGSGSRKQDREYFTKEPAELSVTMSRGFTSCFIGQLGARYRVINHFDFEPGRTLSALRATRNPAKVEYASLVLGLRYDTRDSFVNPLDGLVLQGESEFASGTASFSRLGLSVQHYTKCISSNAVLALRLDVQGVIGDHLPLQLLLPAGGNNTLRGYPQDRFLDRGVLISNAEFRFPICWRFGGVVGIDAGRVWRSFSDLDLQHWGINVVGGFRFHTDTFIVRLDAGLSSETTGLYLNFGQMF